MAGTLIVGAGECGVRVAFGLRESGYGKPITLIGNEQHWPYERPPLSKSIRGTPRPIAQPQAYADAGIDLRRGESVRFVKRDSKTATLSSGAHLTYDTLVLATGARARTSPDFSGASTFRCVEDAARIHARLTAGMRLAIIGGGFIGLELAALAVEIGAQVTVVEAAPRLLSRNVPTEIAAVLEGRHRHEGVTFHIGTGVENATETGVTLRDGSKISADLVIAGIGAVPNTGLAEACGLNVDDGIRVNERLRTEDPDIYAAGDCASFPYRGRHIRLESWRAAQDQGNHVARTICGAREPYDRTPWFWSDQYDLSLQITGVMDPDSDTVRRDIDDQAFILFHLDQAGALTGASAIGPGNSIARDIRVAENLIERRKTVPRDTLSDRSVRLKSLLRD